MRDGQGVAALVDRMGKISKHSHNQTQPGNQAPLLLPPAGNS